MNKMEDVYLVSSAHIRHVFAALRNAADLADRETIIVLIKQAMIDILREENAH